MTWCNIYVCVCSDYFYQFGEIRSLTVVPRQQCAFVQYTTRVSAEAAAERSFNKLILNGQRLNIKWGKSQGMQQPTVDQKDNIDGRYLEPVPGLPGCKKFTYSVIRGSLFVCLSVADGPPNGRADQDQIGMGTHVDPGSVLVKVKVTWRHLANANKTPYRGPQGPGEFDNAR